MNKSIAVLWMMSFLITSNTLASNYHYDNHAFDAESQGMPRHFYINLKESYTLDPTNEYRSLVLCTSDGKYFCVKDGLFTFAVPLDPLKVGDNWNIEGRDFTVKNEIELKLLGKSEKTYLISSKINKYLKFQFFYSIEHGLLAFSITSLDDENTERYFLREDKGLGSRN
ncbi:hypothetical protein [Arsukibacterium sp.]|uniref:hypothetical protein n=1 Tax=Arsukibacterium sp. TaxID=1977258 RepID=UPI002FDA539B